MRKVHVAQAKEHRRKNQLACNQTKLEHEPSVSSNLNSSSASKNKTLVDNQVNVTNSNVESIRQQSGIEVNQKTKDKEPIKGTDHHVISSLRLPLSPGIFGRKSPPTSHSMEPVLLSVTTV